jgi:hypothetical protein
LFIFSAVFPVINSQNAQNNIKQIQNNSTCDLLIISPSNFIRYLQPLVYHKNQYGVRTKLVSLDYIYNQIWYGRDEAEKVKLFIKEAIEESGIKYVLLVGGSIGLSNHWYCPVRYSQMSNDYEQQILSDLYFADIYDSEGNFSSWDSDGDGVFCEWIYGEQPEDKYLDLYPDIAVGRLPCKSSLEVKIMVGKIIRYEKTTYNKSWFKNMVAFAGDTYPECNNPKFIGYEGEYYADLAFENMTGFNQEKHYTSDGTLTNWSDINNALNKGWGFVYFNGHANAAIWNTYYANSTLRIGGFTIKHIRFLHNGDKLPICIVGGCHSSQFDVSLLKYFDKKLRNRGEGINECWSWIMTRKIGGGSIATIGITALGFTKEDKESFTGGSCELEVQFFKQYGQNNVDIIGDTWVAAIKWYIDTYPVNWQNELTNDSWIDTQVVQTWALFGDPSLKIGGYPPSMLEVVE